MSFFLHIGLYKNTWCHYNFCKWCLYPKLQNAHGVWLNFYNIKSFSFLHAVFHSISTLSTFSTISKSTFFYRKLWKVLDLASQTFFFFFRIINVLNALQILQNFHMYNYSTNQNRSWKKPNKIHSPNANTSIPMSQESKILRIFSNFVFLLSAYKP